MLASYASTSTSKSRSRSSSSKKSTRKFNLHGRDSEQLQLLQCLERIHSNSQNKSKSINKFQTTIQQRALILVSGYSGTGKTALALSLTHVVETKYNGLLVSGKYDLYLRDEPYSAILAACREICGAILMLQKPNTPSPQTNTLTESINETKEEKHSEKHTFSAIQQALIRHLGEEDIRLLLEMIPELEEIILTQEYLDTSVLLQRSTMAKTESSHSQQCQAKVHHAFRLFLQTLTSFIRPLVIVLDDLQWADISSLDLLEAIIKDCNISNLILIGLYRSNEVDEPHWLNKNISNFQQATSIMNTTNNNKDVGDANKKSNNNNNNGGGDEFELLQMQIGNLSLEGVHLVLMDLLSLDDTDETKALSKLLHQRTKGNVFFLLSFIAMLESERLLDFQIMLHKYTWDIEKIRAETSASENVVDLVQSKLSKLPAEISALLSIGACLGNTFALDTLELVWNQFQSKNYFVSSKMVSNSYSDDGKKAASVSEMISVALENDILERHTQWKTYRWIHDKVQEAACGLIPKNELRTFKIQVGTILLESFSSEELETSLFLVMNLLNEYTIESMNDTMKQVRLAKLNLRATEKAVTYSAFSSASNYSNKGIEFLPSDHWTSHPQLSIDLYSYAVEASKFLGNKQIMMEYGNVVMARSDIPTTDKFRVNHALIYDMCTSKQQRVAISNIVEVLGKLGHGLPRYSIGVATAILKDFLKVKSIIKDCIPENIDKLPTMTDEKCIQAMQYMDVLVICGFMAKSLLAPLGMLRSAPMTHKFGLCESSPIAYCSAAMFLSITGDIRSATQLGEYAKLLLEKVSKRPRSQTKFMLGTFIFSVSQPYQHVMALHLEGYDDGMTVGDFEHAMLNILSYVIFQYLAGRKISLIVADCRIYSKQANDHKQDEFDPLFSICWQTVLNLSGASEYTSELRGEIIPDLDVFVECLERYPPYFAPLRGSQLRLCLIYGEYEKGSNIFVKHLAHVQKVAPGNPMLIDVVFCGGMCCFEMARRKPKSRQSRIFANKAYSLVKNWCKNGNPNVQHYKVLYDAEKAAWKKDKRRVADELFQDAISQSARGGFLHDAALASEVYSMFLMDQDDREGGMFHLEKSIEFYLEWGANRKVSLLKKYYASLKSW